LGGFSVPLRPRYPTFVNARLERPALPAPAVDQARALLIASRRGVGQILTFAPLDKLAFLLKISRCKNLLQKFGLLQDFCGEQEENIRVSHAGYRFLR
jgi:hypothetical protein